jgi:hypothetical protein
MEFLRVQLKVCEGCGGLWFRTQSKGDVYGRCCASKLAQHAKARPDQHSGRRMKRHRLAASTLVTIGGIE